MGHHSRDHEAIVLFWCLIYQLLMLAFGLTGDLSGVNAGYVKKRLRRLPPLCQQQHSALIAANAFRSDIRLQEFVQRLQTGQLQFFEATLPSRPGLVYSPFSGHGCRILLALDLSACGIKSPLPVDSLLESSCAPLNKSTTFRIDLSGSWLNRGFSLCTTGPVAAYLSHHGPLMVKPSSRATGRSTKSGRISKASKQARNISATLPIFISRKPDQQRAAGRVNVKKRGEDDDLEIYFACPLGKFHPERWPECTAAKSKWKAVRSLFRKTNKHLNWHLEQGHMTEAQREELAELARAQGDHEHQVEIWRDGFCVLYPEFIVIRGVLIPYVMAPLLLDGAEPEGVRIRLRRRASIMQQSPDINGFSGGIANVHHGMNMLDAGIGIPPPDQNLFTDLLHSPGLPDWPWNDPLPQAFGHIPGVQSDPLGHGLGMSGSHFDPSFAEGQQGPRTVPARPEDMSDSIFTRPPQGYYSEHGHQGSEDIGGFPQTLVHTTTTFDTPSDGAGPSTGPAEDARDYFVLQEGLSASQLPAATPHHEPQYNALRTLRLSSLPSMTTGPTAPVVSSEMNQQDFFPQPPDPGTTPSHPSQDDFAFVGHNEKVSRVALNGAVFDIEMGANPHSPDNIVLPHPGSNATHNDESWLKYINDDAGISYSPQAPSRPEIHDDGGEGNTPD